MTTSGMSTSGIPCCSGPQQFLDGIPKADGGFLAAHLVTGKGKCLPHPGQSVQGSTMHSEDPFGLPC